MLKTKKDKIIIKNLENNIISHIFELNEKKEAEKQFEILVNNDLQYFNNPQHEMKTLNAYWYNGMPFNRRK